MHIIASSRALLLFLFAVLLGVSQGARILGVFPVVSHSHFVLGNRLFKALAARGHDVVFVSPYKEKGPVHKNFREVNLKGFIEVNEENNKNINFFDWINMPSFAKLFFMYSMGLTATNLTLEHEAVQRIIKSNEKFDLVITEPFITDALRVFGHHFDAPTVLLSSFGSSSVSNYLVGNPAPLSHIPDFIIDHSGPMDFCTRVKNVVIDVLHQILRQVYVIPNHNALAQKHFPGAPCVSELNTSLILLNSHPSVTAPAPHVPNMIEVGGFHVDPPKPLPAELKKYLDEAREGVIYFSFGSIVKSASMSEATKKVFLDTFAKLKMKVLWKFEDDQLSGRPDNVRIEKWLPQQDVLAHPNVKIFISHGGLLSTIESIHYGKPTIGIPIFAEQLMNVKQSVQAGFSLMLTYSELSVEKLTDAINEMISNPKYAITAHKRSKILHDQPMKPIDHAVYWVEFVLRHDGAEHFRSLALNLNWFQRISADVVIFLVFCTILCFAIFYYILKKCCCRNKKLSDAKQKTQKQKRN